MKDMNVIQKIKTGFWLGIGLIIPLFIYSLIGLIISYATTKIMTEEHYENLEKRVENVVTTSTPNLPTRQDLKDQIKITNYREVKRERRIIILGVVENTGPQSVSSIQLQAEFFDSKGQFVLECDEFLSNVLQPKDKENFQISCGCSDTPLPEYQSLKLKISTARNY